MKKIIPFFTKIYSVVLYIDEDNKPSISYSAYNIFNKNRNKQKFADMPKLHFTDINSANLCLATTIYPNIEWDATVENVTFDSDKQEEQEFAATGVSRGGSGNQFYFSGTKNLKNHYFDFYMAREQLVRREILAKHKQAKTK
ncbi:MAG: hypothetical protein E7007_00035 [Alphaproteobacteria bacterium]|nr:hypothetical protein [Alphaproteobacteria bacterium]